MHAVLSPSCIRSSASLPPFAAPDLDDGSSFKNVEDSSDDDGDEMRRAEKAADNIARRLAAAAKEDSVHLSAQLQKTQTDLVRFRDEALTAHVVSPRRFPRDCHAIIARLKEERIRPAAPSRRNAAASAWPRSVKCACARR